MCPIRCVGEKVVPGISTNVSVIAPTELRIDSVCCVGLSSHGTLLLHNPTSHWICVQLAVKQINIDGQPADHHISPFVVRPKATIDPNSTESVKVQCSTSISTIVCACPILIPKLSKLIFFSLILVLFEIFLVVMRNSRYC